MERDKDCEFKELCEETRAEIEVCKGVEECGHYNSFLEGKCVALEAER